MIYLDNAATTKVCEQSIAAADRAMRELWGNPSSLYNMGFEAKKALDRARRTIADAMGCTEQELYFTACGTESNNIAILGAARARKKWGKNIVVTGYEHPSVGNTVDSLEKEGFEIRRVMPSKYGTVSLDELLSRVDSETALVTAMAVNNETGAVIDIKRLAQGVKSINSRTAVHCDCVQSFLKTKIKLKDTLVDTASVSGHKVHAPKGVGALYVRKGFNLEHSQFGGGQERGLRSGTENTAQIVHHLGVGIRPQRMRIDGLVAVMHQIIDECLGIGFLQPLNFLTVLEQDDLRVSDADHMV